MVVIRYEGPKGGPGMPEMLTPTSAIMGAGLGNDVALITDGRFSGGSHGFIVGHITPEAQDGGPIALRPRRRPHRPSTRRRASCASTSATRSSRHAGRPGEHPHQRRPAACSANTCGWCVRRRRDA